MVDPGGAFSGTTHDFSQQGTFAISCRRAASVVAALIPILRRVDIVVYERVIYLGVFGRERGKFATCRANAAMVLLHPVLDERLLCLNDSSSS
jgi:hypothetical protein